MGKEINTTYIYILIDPITNSVRYVGKSVNPLTRYSQHCNAYDNSEKYKWILDLKNNGYKPEMKIIDKVPNEIAHERESFYITEYLKNGHDLFNISSVSEWATVSFKVPLPMLEKLKLARIKSELDINEFYINIINDFFNQSKCSL